MSTATNASVQNEELPESTDLTDGLTQETAFEMLSCRRRRDVLHYLKQRDGEPATLRTLSVQLAAWENDVDPERVTYTQRMRVYTALRQSHLPKMDRAGVVEFDADAGTVTLTDEASELEVYLDVVPHDEIPWSKYYLGLGVLSAGLVAVTWLGVFPFSLLPCPLTAAVTTALLTASALAHWRHDVEMKLGGKGDPPE